MPTFEITSPDGAVYHVDGPDGATEQQAMQQVMAQHQQPQGFAARVGQDYQNRVSEGQQAADSYVAGRQSLPLTYLDFAGKIGAGTAIDAGGEALKSAASVIPQGVKDAATSGLHYLASTPPGRDAVGAAQYVGGKYADFAQGHPDAARHIEAATNIGGLLAPEIPFKGTNLARATVDAAQSGGKAVAQAAGSTARAVVEHAGNAVDAITPEAVPNITRTQARTLAGSLYKKADEIGAVASPIFTNNKILGAINSQAPETVAGSIGRADSPFTKWALDANEKLAGKPQSLTALQELDENLSDHIDKYTDRETHLPTAEAIPFMNAQSEIRAATNPSNLTSSDLISGSPQAIQAWKAGQGVWSDSYKLGDLERIDKRASLMPNPSQARQVGYRQLAMSPKFGLYTPEQQDLILKGAKTGAAVRGLQFVGSGLTTIGAGLAAGPLAGVGGFVAGIPARAAADALQARPGAALNKSIREGILNRFPDYAAPGAVDQSAPLLLESPEARFRGKKTEQPIYGSSPSEQRRLPSPETPTPNGVGTQQAPNVRLENAQAALRNAARGNTEQPLLSGDTIQMRPANQLTIGARGNLGTQLIMKVKEMAAEGKTPQEIDQFIRTVLKNRNK